jgi:hypothetical protein
MILRTLNLRTLLLSTTMRVARRRLSSSSGSGGLVSATATATATARLLICSHTATARLPQPLCPTATVILLICSHSATVSTATIATARLLIAATLPLPLPHCVHCHYCHCHTVDLQPFCHTATLVALSTVHCPLPLPLPLSTATVHCHCHCPLPLLPLPLPLPSVVFNAACRTQKIPKISKIPIKMHENACLTVFKPYSTAPESASRYADSDTGGQVDTGSQN